MQLIVRPANHWEMRALVPRPLGSTTMVGLDTDPFTSAQLGPITLRNRFIKAATFEGMAIDNGMSDAIIDFHLAHAVGGLGMTTLAYCAVSHDGQGAPNEIVVRPEVVPGLARFTAAIHDTGAQASMQLGHAGPVSRSSGGPGLASGKTFMPQAMKFTTPATDDDLTRIMGLFGEAAGLAAAADFDCIELHFGHGYLISNFLSPKHNKRDDRWGGSLENRARLALEVAQRVRDAVGDRCAVTAKINLSDGVPGGFWVDECVQVAQMLEATGALDALELSGGSSFENAMYFFRGEPPIEEMLQMFPKALRPMARIGAKRLMPHYPFTEAFFLPEARQVRAAVDMPLILLGGINKLETVKLAMEEGFDFVAMGRALLREPNLISKWQQGETTQGLCIHCNKCMPSIYAGTHCVLVPEASRPGHAHWPPPRAAKTATH